MNTKHFQEGEVIFQEGEISHEAFYIVSGMVEISIQNTEGPLVLGRLGTGEIFGEMGMITDRPRSATATALEPTTVESINEAEFEADVLGRPDRLHAYLATLFDRIRTTDLLLQMEWQKHAAREAGLTPAAARRERVAMLGAPSAGRTGAAAQAPLTHRLRLKSAEGGRHAVNVEITSLPFRIGRAFADSRVALFARNDLAIPDQQPFHVSRNHCEIDLGEQGFIVRDRGSTLGCIVNNSAIGSHAEGFSAALHEGDNYLLLGSDDSPFRYVLTVEKA